MTTSEENGRPEHSETAVRAPDPAAERPDGFIVVGLGASAGGVEALRTFFENVAPDSGMAYVVILHLSPDFDSQLAEILQATTTIPVTQVEDSTKVEPDHVYVIPPNRHLSMLDGSITVTPNLLTEDRRAPVDIFFRTLAESHGPRAIAVVLSGTGANGSMGIKRVKEKGGAAFVQNPREAEFAEMPRNSIATELIDEVLPVAEIPAKLVAYRDSIGTIEIPVEAEQRTEDMQQALREVFTQLRVRTGHDFSNYKRPTLLRRIERRINIRNLPDLPSYAEFIRENHDEAQALLKDLLISVTNFFRDRKAFEYLEQTILPAIFSGKTSADQVRIWVAGCATGEEAYSIAMLCAERSLGAIDAPKVQIFATDIDTDAIVAAREGLYTLNDAADVSPERLQRFFTKEGSEYRIRREIREMVMFANHNLLKDPPFSHLDLATCRNLLIYLNSQAKERVMETIHFALEPGGYLFLGSSEAVEGAADLFALASREHHVYQSRRVGLRSYPIPESIPVLPVELRAATARPQDVRSSERITYGELHQQLLEKYAAPSVVVNEEYDVVHLSDRAGRFMQVPGGEPTNNILRMVLPELRLELTTALYQAAQRKANVDARGVGVMVDDHLEMVDIRVRPVLNEGDTARGFILIVFEPAAELERQEPPLLTSAEPLAHQLEEELRRSKQQLRTSSEQYEIQAEELKASNEELQAMNEELRSTAEELETSKEELQSINEELRTVNQELKVKVEETTISRNNLQNLMNSTAIGTIFLDRGNRVRLFTPAASELFNLIPADFGRPLTDITHRLDYDGIIADVTAVLEKLNIVEREVSVIGGERDYLMRVLPYRTDDDRINGVVITFVEITERKKAQKILELQTEELGRFNDAMVGREQRMIELKKEVNELCERLGETKRYPMDFEE